MKKLPKISIVIPTRNREEKLQRLITSIQSSDYPNNLLQIIIINNGDKLNKKFDVSEIVQNDKNRGLAAARNQGAELASGEYVLFIDDDNVIAKEMIRCLIETFLKYPDYLVLGPLTYYLSKRDKIWFAGATMNLWTLKPHFFSKDEVENKEIIPSQIVHNCLMVRKRDGQRIGWFDKKIFMNGTEMDLIKRLEKKNNSEIAAVVRNAKCFHDMPTMQKDLIRSLGFENSLRVYYFQRNRGVFLKRYGNFLQKASVGLIFIPLSFVVYAVIFISRRRGQLLINEVKGTIAAYYYLFRPL